MPPVLHPCYTRAISECFRDKELIYKALYKFDFFTLLFTLLYGLWVHRSAKILAKPDNRDNGSLKER